MLVKSIQRVRRKLYQASPLFLHEAIGGRRCLGKLEVVAALSWEAAHGGAQAPSAGRRYIGCEDCYGLLRTSTSRYMQIGGLTRNICRMQAGCTWTCSVLLASQRFGQAPRCHLLEDMAVEGDTFLPTRPKAGFGTGRTARGARHGGTGQDNLNHLNLFKEQKEQSPPDERLWSRRGALWAFYIFYDLLRSVKHFRHPARELRRMNRCLLTC